VSAQIALPDEIINYYCPRTQKDRDDIEEITSWKWFQGCTETGMETSVCVHLIAGYV
jgi:hypothetical protein